MERNVTGIRDTFFSDLWENYKGDNRDSFVYAFTWRESAVELLKKLKDRKTGDRAYFSGISTQAPQGKDGERKEELLERLAKAMEARAGEPLREELRRELEEERRELRRERRERQKKEGRERPRRRDLWQRLWINGSAFRAGLLTEDEYALWLVEYLAARKKYYLDRCPSVEDEKALREELCRLVVIGLRGKDRAPEPQRPEEEKKGKKGKRTEEERQRDRQRRLEDHLEELAVRVRSGGKKGRVQKALLGAYLEQLAEEMRAEDDEGKTRIVHRLREAGCLDRLWESLEPVAMHMKVKNWFQDSGFPLRMEELDEDEVEEENAEQEKEREKLDQQRTVAGKREKKGKKQKKPREYPPPKGDRKQDFTMRLFEAYCDSERGYDFFKKRPGGGSRAKERQKDRQLYLGEFLVLEEDHHKIYTLVRALKERAGKRRGLDRCYIPLAIHLYTGCVFFLAGSSAYEKAEAEDKGKFCFDFLLLGGVEEKYPTVSGALGNTFRMRRTFHENVGESDKDMAESYEDVLREFVVYSKNVSETAIFFNEDCEGIPDAFRWAFWEDEDRDQEEPSRESEAAFDRDTKDCARSPGGRY